LGAQIKKNEMGGASGIYGGEGRCIQGFGEKNMTGRDHFSGGRMILEWIFKK
jgi:hypothetical protein